MNFAAPAGLDVGAEPLHAGPFAAAREGRAGVNRPAAEVQRPRLADGTISLERQADRVEPLVADGAGLVRPVTGQRLAQGPVAELGLVVGEVGDIRRGRRDLLAQEPAHDPVPALDRARPQPRRVPGQEDGHR